MRIITSWGRVKPTPLTLPLPLRTGPHNLHVFLVLETEVASSVISCLNPKMVNFFCEMYNQF